MMDELKIGSVTLKSRLIIGTGKYRSNALMPEIIEKSGADMITLAVRRVDPDHKEENILSYIPKNKHLLPNTSGARTAEEALRIARLARAMGCGNCIKIEIVTDSKYLLPDNMETLKAVELLAKEDFIPMAYMSPDLMMAKHMQEVGAAAIMPLGAPIGTNRGLQTKAIIELMIEELNVPIIVDAGIGKPSEAASAMEMGAAAVMLNTAIATSGNEVMMAEAFKKAVEAGRLAYLAGCGNVTKTAIASSPLTGFLGGN